MAGGARVSPRRGRVRAVVVIVAERRAGVSPRAPGGGGEPRAARAHAARSRSLPAPPATSAARRRARSLLTPSQAAGPRLRPVFLWARQRCDGLVHEVHCEDYDERNRLRVARTDRGWRVIPRTEIYDAISLPPRRRRRRHRQRQRRRRRSAAAAWLAPDLESHIPSHTIAVPRAPPEPTPLENLLAVAELELREQQGDLLALGDAVANDVMSFDLPDAKASDAAFYERKATSERTTEDDLGAKDLFETISEAHYLPELHGPHDEELLESLVEKGCEDNQILGQALDKLAHLVHHSDYVEEEENILLSSAPVVDIIDRLEQSLESPGRSSMTAAQGLLHLHQLAEHHAPASYSPDDNDVFTTPPVTHSDCSMEALAASEELPHTDDLTHIQFEETNDEKRLDLETHIQDNQLLNAEIVPETNESYEQQPPESITNLIDAELPPSNTELIHDLPPPNCDLNTEIPVQETDHNFENQDNDENELPTEPKIEQEDDNPMTEIDHMELVKEIEDATDQVELVPTDLRMNHVEKRIKPVVSNKCGNTNSSEDNLSEKSDEQPRDLSVHRRLPTPHASPRRIEIPRAPSRESDAMQSPQPSGIPAVPSSPEIFSVPHTKSKHTLFLESLLSSPSPKMYTSEVTISKQQCEPLNLGKHRKSASPTVTSCSDEIKKINKEFGEPQEKRVRHQSTEELAKISKVFNKCNEEVRSNKNPDVTIHNVCDETSPLQQFHMLKTSPDFHLPNPLLVPRDKLDKIIAAPAREIPALLLERPELRLPDALEYPDLRNSDLVVVNLTQLENILANEAKKLELEKNSESTISKTATVTEKPSKTTPDQTGQPKPIASMDALAGDIDAATSAALNQMFWLPYLSQLEAMAACSQNMDFLKALNSSGYSGPNYNDLSQMFPSSRYMNPAGFPVMAPVDYDNRLQFAMWQEVMNQANASTSQRPKQSSMEAHMKEMASKSSDVQNPYVHSTKNHQSKPHSSARTSPIAHNYNTNQRAMNHNPYLQGMYPGINPNIRPNMPLPGLQIPYFNPNMMGSQRSPRTAQQKSPTSPYFPNNNYLHSLKQSEAQGRQRTSSTSSQESPRPRISVKSLHNLLEPAAASGSSMRRTPNPPHASMARRREEPEVGSTTPLGEPPPHLPPHPHDPASFHLWHPLFGNQKNYNSPWPWTTVTATGD